MLDSPWIRRLFFGLAVLYMLPVWVAHYLPTTDGPCHTYNAWVLQQLWSGEASPVIREHYEVNLRPFPNWTGQALMAVLLFAMPPLVAEKIMVSGALLLFLGGVWALAGAVRPGERWPAFLAFPFAYNLFFQFGFYNFYLSLGLYLLVLAVWWRHRERPDPAFAVKINLLLLLCYFSHIVSLVLALLSIAVLWLATLWQKGWRTHLLHVPILLPQLILPLWFLRPQGGGGVRPGSARSFEQLRAFLFPPQVLLTFSEIQLRLAAVVAVAFLALAILTLWHTSLREGRRPTLTPEDGFLLLTAVLVWIYMVSPEGMAGGSILVERLSLYPWLVLIPWLAPGLGLRWRAVGTAALALLAAVNFAYLLHWHDKLGRDMDRFMTALAKVRPDSRILPLVFQRTSTPARADIYGHAAAYVALEKGLIDWDNYQAKVDFFPVHFRSSVRLPNLEGVPFNPGVLRVRLNRNRIDALYTWGLPLGHPLEQRLRRHYRLMAESDRGALWERKRHTGSSPVEPPPGSRTARLDAGQR